MIKQSEIDRALAAADDPVMVETPAQLQINLERWLECAAIGIDTEFVRERTWRAELGLVQLSDGETVWLLDPLKCGSIEPLADLFEQASSVKILHAPSEDLDVLLYTTRAIPRPLFDTQIACALLGQSLQMAYHTTVEWLLGVAVDKGETRSNWCKRPLRPAQLHYAALDVCLLPLMQRKLQARLKELGRLEWLQEDCERSLKRALTPADPEDSWRRVNGNGRLDGTGLAVLQSLAKWRDGEAEKRNLARGFVIKDAALLKIALKRPGDLDALEALDVLHPRTLQRSGKDLLAVIERVVGQGRSTEALKPLHSQQRQALADMRKLVKSRADELAIEPALLASRRELEGLIRLPADAPLPDKFTGWRHDVITREILSMRAQIG